MRNQFKYWTLLLIFLPLLSQAKLQEEQINYTANGINMKGFLVWDDRYTGKRPGIIVVHEWWGLNDYVRERAKQLALMGYSAFAIDMYGDGKNTEHPKTAKKFATMVSKNLPGAKLRFNEAMKVLTNHPTVDKNEELSAIGYCFGGGIILNMARAGFPLKGVASFHGSLKSATPETPNIRAEVIVFNGNDDKVVPAEQVINFKQEMQANKVDYKYYGYADTVHAFTNPSATAIGKKLGASNIAYNRHADSDSWAKLSQFLSNLYTK